MGDLVQELTVTNFVFRRSPGSGQWLTGMIWHARLGHWMPACGHVEAGEIPALAAVRETLEELGCRVRFLHPPGLRLPDGFPHPRGIAPWWVVDMPASADSHTPARHRHQDYVFVSEWVEDAQAPETETAWMSEAEVAEHPGLADDSRLQAIALIGHLRAADEAGRDGA